MYCRVEGGMVLPGELHLSDGATFPQNIIPYFNHTHPLPCLTHKTLQTTPPPPNKPSPPLTRTHTHLARMHPDPSSGLYSFLLFLPSRLPPTSLLVALTFLIPTKALYSSPPTFPPPICPLVFFHSAVPIKLSSFPSRRRPPPSPLPLCLSPLFYLAENGYAPGDRLTSWVYSTIFVQYLYASCCLSENKPVLSYLLLHLLPQW